ncbi:MAG: hypothetical protein ABI743_14555, partial [bacterium]
MGSLLIRRHQRGRERGSIIATVLLFLAFVLPVSLILLNTMQIETLLPANENIRLLARHEADKGFDAAMNELFKDNEEGTMIEVQTDPSDPTTVTPVPAIANPAIEPPDANPTFGNLAGFIPYIAWQVTDPTWTYFQPFYNRGEHEVDFLGETWARHPENNEYYLASRSVENRPLPANRDDAGNVPSGDPDDYSVPERWVLTDVPFGMDDFSEVTLRDDRKRLDTGFDAAAPAVPIGPSSPLPVDQPVPTGGSSFDGQPEGLPLDNGSDWAISPADPFYSNPDVRADEFPRPASYFRNNQGRDADIPDTLTYDAQVDNIGPSDTNQYLDYPPLQQLVRASGWANIFFGSDTVSPNRANYEYKPQPGAITRYQIGGANSDQAIPGWYQSIVSDESGRFPINGLLNIIFQGANYTYQDVTVPTTGNVTATPEVPAIVPDKFDPVADADDLMFDPEHPNHDNYLLARDMLASLFLDDATMRDVDSGASNLDDAMHSAQGKANYIIREMLFKRARLDRDYDGNSDG